MSCTKVLAHMGLDKLLSMVQLTFKFTETLMLFCVPFTGNSHDVVECTRTHEY